MEKKGVWREKKGRLGNVSTALGGLSFLDHIGWKMVFFFYFFKKAVASPPWGCWIEGRERGEVSCEMRAFPYHQIVLFVVVVVITLFQSSLHPQHCLLDSTLQEVFRKVKCGGFLTLWLRICH